MTGRDVEDRDWQRLDTWLWCARFAKARSDCARLVVAGAVRLNRQPTEKPHARLRPGDVLTLAIRDQVRVLRVLSLALRRGPAPEAQALYEELPDPSGDRPAAPLHAEPLHESGRGGISGAAGGAMSPSAPDHRQER
ncbi:RNA-binding S4 domain-containing protein [Acidisoma cladoniae]|jgi:ribosome-associated heat shock protein Hsp15|uniref:RNA-binding S4 domain-containing protein n=1 Tax=Acidisoma cladoniae TaxID=3040935 RepID=UPI00254D3AFC|nr:S4 domain-containing protein [Acidisoma sp. PAMC 29798]